MKPLAILLVDDEIEIGKHQGDLLRSRGAVVRTARDGMSALQEAIREVPDLVVSDLQMPGRSGEWLAAELKIRWPRLPVILQIGSFGALQADSLMNLGVDAVVIKPVAIDEIWTQIEKLRLPPSQIWRSSAKLHRRAQHLWIEAADLVGGLREKQISIGRRGLFFHHRGWIGQTGSEISVGVRHQSEPLLTGNVRWVRPIEREGLRPGLGIEIEAARADVVRQIDAILDIANPQASIPLS